ncbi:PITH domain-containing protein [Lyophyllum atratum]|nr:PITH domain-containing protein [Lyophyllum atratum]
MAHNHSHGQSCNSESHDHDHDHNDLTPAIQSSLYQHIEFDKIVTFNEATTGSGKAVIQKPWDQRLDTTTVLESDADEQLLIYVPFTGDVKLHSILIRADPSPGAPRTLKLFINRDDVDFTSAADLRAVQTLEIPLPLPGQDVLELPVKRALFNNTHSLTLFIEDNQSDGEEDVTSLSFLGFKGDFTQLRKDAVVAFYEAAANPADHKNLVPGAQYGAVGL